MLAAAGQLAVPANEADDLSWFAERDDSRFGSLSALDRQVGNKLTSYDVV